MDRFDNFLMNAMEFVVVPIIIGGCLILLPFLIAALVYG
jgi:hypothetical protein